MLGITATNRGMTTTRGIRARVQSRAVLSLKMKAHWLAGRPAAQAALSAHPDDMGLIDYTWASATKGWAVTDVAGTTPTLSSTIKAQAAAAPCILFTWATCQDKVVTAVCACHMKSRSIPLRTRWAR